MAIKKKGASTKTNREQLPREQMPLGLFPENESPYYKCFVFNKAKKVGDLPSVDFITPVAFIFNGQVFTTKTWRKLILSACDALYEWNSERLYDAVKNDATPIRPFYRERIATLDNPVLHKPSGIWIDLTMSAEGALNGVWKLCRKCGAPMERIVVIYEEDPN